MGHASDANNRIKNNRRLLKKSSPYQAFKDYSKLTPKNSSLWKLKKPTPIELEKSKKSNQKYLRKQKQILLLQWIVGLVVGFLIIYFLADGFVNWIVDRGGGY